LVEKAECFAGTILSKVHENPEHEKPKFVESDVKLDTSSSSEPNISNQKNYNNLHIPLSVFTKTHFV